jgi:hypothetical protein
MSVVTSTKTRTFGYTPCVVSTRITIAWPLNKIITSQTTNQSGKGIKIQEKRMIRYQAWTFLEAQPTNPPVEPWTVDTAAHDCGHFPMKSNSVAEI